MLLNNSSSSASAATPTSAPAPSASSLPHQPLFRYCHSADSLYNYSIQNHSYSHSHSQKPPTLSPSLKRKRSAAQTSSNSPLANSSFNNNLSNIPNFLPKKSNSVHSHNGSQQHSRHTTRRSSSASSASSLSKSSAASSNFSRSSSRSTDSSSCPNASSRRRKSRNQNSASQPAPSNRRHRRSSSAASSSSTSTSSPFVCPRRYSRREKSSSHRHWFRRKSRRRRESTSSPNSSTSSSESEREADRRRRQRRKREHEGWKIRKRQEERENERRERKRQASKKKKAGRQDIRHRDKDGLEDCEGTREKDSQILESLKSDRQNRGPGEEKESPRTDSFSEEKNLNPQVTVGESSWQMSIDENSVEVGEKSKGSDTGSTSPVSAQANNRNSERTSEVSGNNQFAEMSPVSAQSLSLKISGDAERSLVSKEGGGSDRKISVTRLSGEKRDNGTKVVITKHASQGISHLSSPLLTIPARTGKRRVASDTDSCDQIGQENSLAVVPPKIQKSAKKHTSALSDSSSGEDDLGDFEDFDSDEDSGSKEEHEIGSNIPAAQARTEGSTKTKPSSSVRAPSSSSSHRPRTSEQQTEKTIVLANRRLKIRDIHTSDRSGRTPIFKYAQRGDAESVKILLWKGADVLHRDHAGWTPLHEACLQGHLDVVAVLVESGADVNARGGDGDTPLHDAVANDHGSVVEFLLTHGAHMDATNDAGMSSRSFAESPEMTSILDSWISHVKSLVDSVDETRRTTLHKRAEVGDLDGVRKCLLCGCDVNASDVSGTRALHLASQHGHASVIRVLCEFGADVDALDSSNSSAISLAISKKHTDVIEILVRFGADVDEECLTDAMRTCISKARELERLWAKYRPVFVDPHSSTRSNGSEQPQHDLDDVTRGRRSVSADEANSRNAYFAWGGLPDASSSSEFVSEREKRKFLATLRRLDPTPPPPAPPRSRRATTNSATPPPRQQQYSAPPPPAPLPPPALVVQPEEVVGKTYEFEGVLFTERGEPVLGKRKRGRPSNKERERLVYLQQQYLLSRSRMDECKEDVKEEGEGTPGKRGRGRPRKDRSARPSNGGDSKSHSSNPSREKSADDSDPEPGDTHVDTKNSETSSHDRDRSSISGNGTAEQSQKSSVTNSGTSSSKKSAQKPSDGMEAGGSAEIRQESEDKVFGASKTPLKKKKRMLIAGMEGYARMAAGVVLVAAPPPAPPPPPIEPTQLAEVKVEMESVKIESVSNNSEIRKTSVDSYEDAQKRKLEELFSEEPDNAGANDREGTKKSRTGVSGSGLNGSNRKAMYSGEKVPKKKQERGPLSSVDGVKLSKDGERDKRNSKGSIPIKEDKEDVPDREGRSRTNGRKAQPQSGTSAAPKRRPSLSPLKGVGFSKEGDTKVLVYVKNESKRQKVNSHRRDPTPDDKDRRNSTGGEEDPKPALKAVESHKKKHDKMKSLFGISGYRRVGHEMAGGASASPRILSADVLSTPVDMNVEVSGDATAGTKETTESENTVDRMVIDPPATADILHEPVADSEQPVAVEDQPVEMRTGAEAASDPESLRKCLPLFAILLSANDGQRYFVDLQVALFVGLKSGRALLDKHPTLVTRVATSIDKEQLEQSVVSEAILCAMLGGDATRDPPMWLPWVWRKEAEKKRGLKLTEVDINLISETQLFDIVLKDRAQPPIVKLDLVNEGGGCDVDGTSVVGEGGGSAMAGVDFKKRNVPLKCVIKGKEVK